MAFFPSTHALKLSCRQNSNSTGNLNGVVQRFTNEFTASLCSGCGISYRLCTLLNNSDDLPLHVVSLPLWHQLLLTSILRIFQLPFFFLTPGQRNAGMSLKFRARAACMQVGNRSVHKFAVSDLSPKTYNTVCSIVLKGFN